MPNPDTAAPIELGRINTLSINEIADMLKTMWAEGGCPPILLVGPPGGGKTTIVSQVAADLGLPCETLMGNTLEPSDVAGIPYLRGEEMVLAPPVWATRIAGKRAVINFDEINTARPATLAALLRVILERRVGDVVLGPDVHVIATMNPAEEAAHGWELPPAVANRFLHFKVAPTSVTEWKAWAARQDEAPEFHQLAQSFPLANLYSEPSSGPFASPRSWYFALKAAGRLMAAGQAHLVQTVVSAAVSPGVALSWADASTVPVDVSDWSTVDPGTVNLMLARTIEAAKADGGKSVDAVWKLVLAASEHHAPALYVLIGHHKQFLSQHTTKAGEVALRAVQDRVK